MSGGRVETLRLRLTRGHAPQVAGLKIVVIEGEDAVNIIPQKTAIRPVVEVRDRNDLPVAGVPVLFTIGGGGGATFAGGAQTVTVTTNAAGRAAVTQLNPVGNGAFQIQVEATYQGQTATATINQTNFATASEAAQAGRSISGQTAAQAAAAPAAGAATQAAAAAAGAGAAAGGGIGALAITGIVAGAAAGGFFGYKAATATEACVFAVTPTSVTLGSGAGTSTVTVSVSPSGCDPPTWNASSSDPSISLNPTSGTGNGSVTLTFTANTTAAQRTASLTIAGQTVSVTQSAPPPWSAGASCQPTRTTGSDVADTRIIDLGSTSGRFFIRYDTGSNSEDRIVVLYEVAEPVRFRLCEHSDNANAAAAILRQLHADHRAGDAKLSRGLGIDLVV